MSRFRYEETHLAFLAEGYKYLSVEALTDEFNRYFRSHHTPTQIKSALSKNKITCGRGTGAVNHGSRLLTLEQQFFVKDLYREFGAADLLYLLNETYGTNYTEGQLRTYLKNHGITSGRTGQFVKGSTPWNTGTKGLLKRNSGCFKKGDIPANVKPIGHERICPKDGYVLVKVAEPNPYTGAKARYRHKHAVVWEQHNGTIPKGMVVSFLDGNKLNTDPANLVLITRAQLCRYNKNRVYSLPNSLVPVSKQLINLHLKVLERSSEIDR